MAIIECLVSDLEEVVEAARVSTDKLGDDKNEFITKCKDIIRAVDANSNYEHIVDVVKIPVLFDLADLFCCATKKDIVKKLMAQVRYCHKVLCNNKRH